MCSFFFRSNSCTIICRAASSPTVLLHRAAALNTIEEDGADGRWPLRVMDPCWVSTAVSKITVQF